MKLIGCGKKNRELEVCLLGNYNKHYYICNMKLQEWQTGDKSKISSLNRMMYHNEWLNQQHLDVKNMIQSKVIVEEKPIQGFVKV
jgi:hypothetical protein